MIDGTEQRLAARAVVKGIALGAGLAIVGTAAGLAGVLLLARRSEWWSGLGAAMVISVLGAVASVGPLGWGLRRGLTQAVAGYFVSAGLRMLVSVGGGVLAVMVGGYPAMPTMLLMVVFYFAVLAAETTTVVRAIWGAKAIG